MTSPNSLAKRPGIVTIYRLCLVAIGACIGSGTVSAQVAKADVEALLATQTGKALSMPLAAEIMPRNRYNEDGTARNISAEPGTYFRHDSRDFASPTELALDFAKKYASVFGNDSANSELVVKRVTSNKRKTYVRLAQSYRGIPVLAGEMIVQVFDGAGVSSVLNDLLRNARYLDKIGFATAPKIDSKTASSIAIKDVAEQYSVAVLALTAKGDPQLVIYDPAILAETSENPSLTWRITVTDVFEIGGPAEHVYVDAGDGRVVLRVPLAHTARNRQIYDSNNNWWNFWGTLKRSEGGSACGIADADALYDRLGECYEFYDEVHGRDSYNDNGLAIKATSRFTWELCCWCPNAIWYGDFDQDRLGFCPGTIVDDVVAHEFTHGVTKYTSGLLYTGESGAINESFSDIWGEFIDLSYGSDNPGLAWLIGEGSSLGTLRDMDDPHNYNQPEVYLESGYWYSGISSAQFVHTNSGVGNKLCHLIVKGDSDFRGGSYAPLASLEGLSIRATAKLYYEVQSNRLTSGADYYDLAWALSDSVSDAATDVIDLGNEINWNASAVAKVVYAIVAVEIW